MSSGGTHGLAALMLSESLLHLLVEEGIIPERKALEAIEGMAELTREIPECDEGRAAVTLIETIAQSFASKEERHVAKLRKSNRIHT
jgi:hypothetical protein